MPEMTVLKPIQVPNSDYCWDQNPPFSICNWFDNEGGQPFCEQGMGPLKYDKGGGVKKCEACLKLKVVCKPSTT